MSSKRCEKLLFLVILISSTLYPASSCLAEDDPYNTRRDRVADVYMYSILGSRRGYSGGANLTAGLTGNLAQSGPVVRVDAFFGHFDWAFRVSGQSRPGQEHAWIEDGGVQAGYNFVGSNFRIVAAVGADFYHDYQGYHEFGRAPRRPGDKGVAPSSGGNHYYRTAGKYVAEASFMPTPEVLLSGFGTYSTAYRNYFTRVRGGVSALKDSGIPVLRDAFIGPEVAQLGNAYFYQTRIGAQATGMKFKSVTFSASVGWFHDTSVRNGAYGSIDFWFPLY